MQKPGLFWERVKDILSVGEKKGPFINNVDKVENGEPVLNGHLQMPWNTIKCFFFLFDIVNEVCDLCLKFGKKQEISHLQHIFY